MSLAIWIASASVAESEDRRQRAEGLLPGHQHLRGDIGEDGRLEETATQCMAFAAQNNFGPFGYGIGDMLLHLFHGGHIDQRPLLEITRAGHSQPSSWPPPQSAFPAKAS